MDIKKYKLGYTSGVYDMFHVGHLNILEQAKAQCEYLIVGVTTDDLCCERKKKRPMINQDDRIRIVRAIKYVDDAIFQENMNKLDVVKKYGIDAVFVGTDWKGTEAWNKYEKQFKRFGCDVVYIDHTDGISSTILRTQLDQKAGK